MFLKFLFQLRILEMTDVHLRRNVHCFAFFPCFFRQLPCWYIFKFFPFFIHCCFCCGNLHGLRHRNKFVNHILMLQWIVTLSCNVVLMIFVWSSFQTLSRRFVGFNDACVFCLTIVQNATSFPVLFASGSAKHAAGIGTSNYLGAFLKVSLNSSSAGSIK